MTTPHDISRRALLVAAPFALGASHAFAEAESSVRHATIVLLRHAEKGDDDPRNPSLSEAGRARATRFAALFARAGTPRLVASEMKRTQQTLEPLAAASGATIDVVPAADVDAWLRELRNGTSALTIAASHSNIVPKLAAGFGVTLRDLDAAGNLPETEFGRVVVLTVRRDDAGATAVAHVELAI